jgi:hypothetical protein
MSPKACSKHCGKPWFPDPVSPTVAPYQGCRQDRQDAGALSAIREAEIRRRLAQDNPARFAPVLATNLDNFSFCLSDAAGVLAVSREQVDIYRQLAQADPARFTPDLTSSLNILSVDLNQAGDHAGGLRSRSAAEWRETTLRAFALLWCEACGSWRPWKDHCITSSHGDWPGQLVIRSCEQVTDRGEPPLDARRRALAGPGSIQVQHEPRRTATVDGTPKLSSSSNAAVACPPLRRQLQRCWSRMRSRGSGLNHDSVNGLCQNSRNVPA